MFYYEDVLRALNKAKIDYVVFGGVAAILYGVHRTTMDIDLMIDLSPANAEKFFVVLAKVGYKPRLPVTVDQFTDVRVRRSWIKDKQMKVFSFYHKDDDCKVIDVSIGQLMKYEDVKKEFVQVGRLNVPVISFEQLKQLKKKAGRPKDLADLDDLKRLEKLL